MSYTEGPWEIAPDAATYTIDGYAGRRLRAVGLPTEVLMLSVGTRSGQIAAIPMDESNVENARLIAAAPDLLEALEEITNYSGGAESAVDDEYVMARVHSAIDKAKGDV